MPLTDAQVRTAKPKDKPYKLTDGAGMYLEVSPNGSKYWRLKYRVAGKEKRLALGVYPEIGLAEARQRRDKARAEVREGQDPVQLKRDNKREAAIAAANSFEAIAREWHETTKGKWTEKHAAQVLTSLEQDIFPALGHRTITAIKAPELLDALRAVEKREAFEIASRITQRCGAVFRYAIATGRAEYNPAGDLRGALKATKPGNYAALSSKELPAFLHKLSEYPTEHQTRLAMRLLMLTAVRTGELIGAEWSEFDTEQAEWRIPAERMKMREEHIVPLSRQALETLEELRALTGRCRLAFPHRSEPTRPMSNVTILRVIERLGYKGQMTGHGFRSVFSTIANESGRWSSDAIERQLAHKPRNRIRAAYNRAEYLPERRKLMQWYADHLDNLAPGANVVFADFTSGSRT